ncbi:hypothetical protein N0V93_009176 [Gnomoniopsis smithogilvyi]|uniref:Uncharacterized protein n=1 Tax=Gnomoniopsis smithogilvyi TaxID=1191159 RepID=A0A9W8YLJ2_9PEZI|nr:hypothetical protein N0V93_009176 [Gnomoniopsis smithogilvyi]
MLSHTWGDGEISYVDRDSIGRYDTEVAKNGYRKIKYARAQTVKHGLNHPWVRIKCSEKSRADKHSVSALFTLLTSDEVSLGFAFFSVREHTKASCILDHLRRKKCEKVCAYHYVYDIRRYEQTGEDEVISRDGSGRILPIDVGELYGGSSKPVNVSKVKTAKMKRQILWTRAGVAPDGTPSMSATPPVALSSCLHDLLLNGTRFVGGKPFSLALSTGQKENVAE